MREFKVVGSGSQAVTGFSSSRQKLVEKMRCVISDAIEKVFVSFFYCLGYRRQ